VYDRERYKDRNLAERLWGKLKQCRRVATRYEKTARNFLAFVHVASIMVLLK
jgi:transposase